ncbi:MULTISPECIES: M23 family metallopeptidase [Euryhalocaulis]|uniref:M23 family metallopeptidase n=1 Tax=Euryhalocaulis TaxID=1712422 RepID=UPI0003A14AC5|nr:MULTISPECIES: M23 family metallopeptidase [Euryhalocaulis]MBA4800355.1 M23 family metallopeptidase [Euryhalocaulis sp.]
MMRLWQQLRETIARIFPERQIYHRTEGRVSYISIGTKLQLAAAASVLIVAMWLLYGTASVFLRGYVISAHDRANAYKVAHYERLLQEARSREVSARNLLQTRTVEFQQLAANLERRHSTLKQLLDHTSETAIADANSGRVMMASVAGDATPRQSRVLSEAGEAPARDFASNGVNARLTALEAEQDRLMAVAETKAEARIETVREAVRLTGLRLSDLNGGEELELGGPYIEMANEGLFGSTDSMFNDRVARVAARIAEAEEMELTLASAPIGNPVGAKTRRTSSFGSRVDPFTRHAAYHTGLDMAAYYRAPVVSTAAGTVSFAGWKGGYGRVVEVDHGHGFKTRYAHLSQITVKKGAKVVTGDSIGLMGSTGRSSGTHLHYEVWFKGKVYDPSKFLKAGEYVQQS